MHRRIMTVIVCLVLAAVASTGFATPITYGDVTGGSFLFGNVREDSITDVGPLFGTPTAGANSLVFNSMAFAAGASGANGADMTDGTLTTTITAAEGSYIGLIHMAEQGGYTLSGAGGTGTRAAVAGSVFLRIQKVDGVAVTPWTVAYNMVFTPSGGDYDLLHDGQAADAAWQGTLDVNIASELAAHGVTGHATEIYLSMDNTMTAASETGTAAQIQKKSDGGLIITPNIPEPATLALVALGSLAMIRRRKA